MPESQQAQAKVLTGIVEVATNRLGNTRAVYRQSYIHPEVFETWQPGALKLAKRPGSIDGLDQDERATLAFLKRLWR